MGFAMVKSAVIDGLEVREVCVEADIGNGLPVFHMVGYLSSEVKEAGERVRTAIRHTKVRLQPQRMVVNLSPADIRKKGASLTCRLRRRWYWHREVSRTGAKTRY